MIDFTKPMLAEEVPEPPVVELKTKEDAQQRARQSLAGIQGAAKAAEEAGLMQKPAPPIKQLQDVKHDGPKSAPDKKPLRPVASTKPGPTEARKKNPARQPPKPPRPDASAALAVDHDRQLRQSALQTVLGGMQAHPDAEAISSLFALYLTAPEKEAASAALVLSMAFLRSPATARGPLLKALAPALQSYRGSRLAILLGARLGHVATARQPPAPVAPPPGG
jgi:hypothetical protein